MPVFPVSFNDPIPEDGVAINTTSRSTNWSRELSPFFLGPVELYDGYVAQNVENGWQYSKVYNIHTWGGEPTEKYWEWAKAGWAAKQAERYPMGKYATPDYSLWAGEKLDYVEARRRIYIPLYAKAVIKTDAFKRLWRMHHEGKHLYLQDFDSYDVKGLGIAYEDVIKLTTRKMGHGLVLGMLLDGFLFKKKDTVA